jgi:hypothetical protein
MCLSPEVDLAAGLIISVVAVDAIRHNRHNRTLPIALLPGIFALHSFASVFVWWSFQGFSFRKRRQRRSRLLYLCRFRFAANLCSNCHTSGGAKWLATKRTKDLYSDRNQLQGLVYLYYIVQGGASVDECTAFLDFHVAGPSWLMSAFYGAATCGAMLFSGYRPLFIWGVLNCIAIVILNDRLSHALPSLWCLWAACTSFFVSWFMRDLIKQRQAGESWPWESSELNSFLGSNKANKDA